MRVHRELGPGFLESAYHQALAIELTDQGVPFQREVPLPVLYRGVRLASTSRADFLCHGDVVVELKASQCLGQADVAQLAHCLRASGARLGLLVNFGGPSLELRRVVLDGRKQPATSGKPVAAGNQPADPDQPAGPSA